MYIFPIEILKPKKLVRQTPIKAGVNRFNTQCERLLYMKIIKRSLIKLLENGFVPNTDNSKLLSKLSAPKDVPEPQPKIAPKITERTVKKIKPTPPAPPAPEPVSIIEEPNMSVAEAFDFALKIKKQSLSINPYSGCQGPVRQFQK